MISWRRLMWTWHRNNELFCLFFLLFLLLLSFCFSLSPPSYHTFSPCLFSSCSSPTSFSSVFLFPASRTCGLFLWPCCSRGRATVLFTTRCHCCDICYASFCVRPKSNPQVKYCTATCNTLHHLTIMRLSLPTSLHTSPLHLKVKSLC